MAEYIKKSDLLELYTLEDLEKYADTLSVPIPVIRQNIMDLPAADVAPVTKHGRWIPNPIMVSDLDGDWIALELHCSLCNRLTYHKEKYCPECGAQMDGEVK